MDKRFFGDAFVRGGLCSGELVIDVHRQFDARTLADHGDCQGAIEANEG